MDDGDNQDHTVHP